MNKYNPEELYIGNVMKNNITIKENTTLFYSKRDDVFYSIEVLNHMIDLETNPSLTPETRRVLEDIVKKYTYPHLKENTSGILFVAEETIRPFMQKNNRKK